MHEAKTLLKGERCGEVQCREMQYSIIAAADCIESPQVASGSAPATAPHRLVRAAGRPGETGQEQPLVTILPSAPLLQVPT